MFTLGADPDSTHIVELRDIEYLPINIYALKEGTLTPIKVPMMTIENTDPRFFWLTNYLETIMSAELWLPMTSASIAFEYKKILTKYARLTGADLGAVAFQGHDFSMRGMGGFEASVLSGMGHILSFTGTDTIPAIIGMEKYYNADIEKELVATSIPATEHSVMCAGSKEDEFNTFKRLINEVYPSGFCSIVSDTWDFWNVVGEFLPMLKQDIMARDGRVVIRPDSGDPVKILVGNPNAVAGSLEHKGLIECLWDIFGGTVTDKGFKQLDNHIGAIYGDAITLDRAEAILQGLMDKGFSSTNVVFGVGSFTYQYNTRDTFGFALKATYAVIDGEEKQLFKDPKTDDGTKKSQKGLVGVVSVNGDLKLVDGMNRGNKIAMAPVDELDVVFVDGKLHIDLTLQEIRDTLNKSL